MRLPVARAAGLLLLLGAVSVLGWFKVCDPDVFWQIKVGEVILDTGRMVRTNVFAASFAEHPWFNPEWLFQVGIALAHRGGGWAGLAAFKFALLFAVAGVLYALLLARRDAPLLAAGVAAAAFAAFRLRLTERPQLASLLLFAATLLLVERARAGRPRLLWALPPLYALWGNLHAELLLGLLWLAGAAVGGWLDGRLARRRGAEPPPAPAVGPGRLALAALASAVASGANPGGWRVLWHPFPHFRQEAIIDLVEFHFSRPGWVPLLWVLLALAVAAACAPRTRRSLAELMPLAGLALLAVRYVREIPFFAIAAAPFLQGALADLLPAGRRGRRLFGAGVAAAVLGFGVWAMRFDRAMHYRWGHGVHDGIFPVAAADFIERERLPPNLYNHYIDGAYLLFRLWPRLGVFQDGRLSAYPEEFMARMHARHSGREWAENLERFRIATALVEAPEARMFFPADRWQTVYEDPRYAVVVRRTPETAALLVRLLGSAYARTPAGVAYRRGIALMRESRPAEAAAAFGDVVRLEPANVDAWHHLGTALGAAGRLDEGIAALEEALRRRPDFPMARVRLQHLRERRGR